MCLTVLDLVDSCCSFIYFACWFCWPHWPGFGGTQKISESGIHDLVNANIDSWQFIDIDIRTCPEQHKQAQTMGDCDQNLQFGKEFYYPSGAVGMWLYLWRCWQTACVQNLFLQQCTLSKNHRRKTQSGKITSTLKKIMHKVLQKNVVLTLMPVRL